jgi:uncharacterized protein YutE (UPF0331/DUF86 family)
MTSVNVIENKISAIKKYLGFLEEYKKHSRPAIENDNTLKGALERYLYLAIQSTIDLAEAMLAFKNLRKPTTYGETFKILEEAGLIDSNLAGKLMNMSGFRNVLTHDYTELNFEIVYKVLIKDLSDIESFVDLMQKEIAK